MVDFMINKKMVHAFLDMITNVYLLSFEPTLITDLVKAGRELEMERVRAIVGACGYFAHFHSS